jgi:cell division protein ZapE
MALMTQYDAAIIVGEISDSSSQREVVVALDKVMRSVMSHRWMRIFLGYRSPVQGLYIYGPVGVGKTYLMDLFYRQLREPRKARFHFHHFMQMIDAELRRRQGARDPVRRIARSLAKSVRVLCLDEFLVNDVADALILAEVLQQLLANGVVLIATANTRPDDLYRDGVHRERFLPAIALIKQACEVMILDDHRDYRLGRAPLLQAYLSPLTPAVHQALVRQFEAISSEIVDGEKLTIQNRPVQSVKRGLRAVWFKFDVICNIPRSQLDYLEIADRFDTVFVSDIPVIQPDDTARVILLIHFVDVMYDRGVRLVISAVTQPEGLYVNGSMRVPFQRTLSRLKEMQSADYLQRHQRAR